MSYKGAGSAAMAMSTVFGGGTNRRNQFVLVAIAIICAGLFAIPSMAKAAAPEVSLQQAVGQVDPTGSDQIDFSLTSNESLVSGSVTTSDFSATNGTIDSVVEVSPAEFTINVTADSDGAVVIAPSGTFEVTDLDEALTQAVASGTDRSVTYDGTPPSVSLEQAATQVDPTNGTTIDFSLTSDETLDAATVEASDFSFTNATFDSISGSGSDFTVTATANADGTVDIAPSGTFAVSDPVGNVQTSAGGADRSVFVDSTPADVSLAAAGGQSDPTSDPAIEFELNSNEDLSGGSVQVTDFIADNGTVDSVGGSGSTFTVSVTATDQGPVKLSPSGTFSVTDQFNNNTTSTIGADPTVLFDTAPVVSLQQAAGQDDPTNAAAIGFSLTSNEDLAGASVDATDFDATNATIDSVTGSGVEFTVAVTATADGAVTIAPSGTFSVDDTNGNFPTTTAGGADRSVTYDSVAPTTSIDSTPTNPSRDATPAFGLSANEAADFQCRIWVNGDPVPPFTACDATYTSTFLAPADYLFETRAIDPAGNTGTFIGYSWTIEPSGITGGPEDLYFTRGSNPVDYRILAEDDQPGALSYTFLSSVGGGTSSAFTVQPDGGTATFTPGDGFAGTDDLTVRVRNTVTNAFTDVTAQVVVRPATRLLTGPAVNVPQLTNDSTPTFTYDAFAGPNEVAISGATFSCKVDNVTQNAGVCSTGSFTTATLSEGAHTFWVRAAKPGINTDPQPQQVTFTVDTIIPNAPTALNGPDGLTNINDATYTFDIPEGSAQCRLISTGDLNPAFGACSSPKVYTDLADDTYQFEVRTKDNAGNVSAAVANDPLTIDTVVDVTIDVAPVDGNLDGKPAIEFSSPEDPTVTYECRLYPTSTNPGEEPAYEACASPKQLPLLDQNISYTFQVKGTDQATNTDVATAVWIQSNTAPAISEPTVTLEAGTSAPVNLGGSDADSDVITYSIVGAVSGGSLGTIDQNTGLVDFTANGNAAGEYTFDYEVTDDRQGGTTSGTATVNVQPNTVFIDEPNAETNDVTPTWTFDSPADSVNTFECNLDGAGWEACDSGSYTPAADLAEGSHTLQVRATIAGLTDPTPASSTTTVDITAPDATVTVTPDALSNDATPVFEFTSTDPTATFECSVDGAGYAACVSGDSLAALTDGIHTFRVHAVDPGGNIGSATADFVWEVDLTLPVISLGGTPVNVTNGPAEGKQTNAKRPVWYFERSDLNLDTAKVRCRIDAQAWLETCLSPFQPPVNLTDGTHTLHIEAEDGATNIGTYSSSFQVDTLAASVAINDFPESPSAPSATFAFTASTGLGAEGRFECRTSFNGGTPGAWSTCVSPLELTGLSSGARKLEVRAIDSAGNASSGAAIASHTWNTVGGTPDTVITGSTTTGKSAAIGFSSPGNPLATFECSLDGAAYTSCTSVKTYTNLSVASHTFNVRAVNEVGTKDASPATKTWTATNPTTPNTDVVSKPSAVTTETSATFEFSSTKAAASFECKLDGGAFAACESPKTYTGLAVGDHTFEVRSSSDSLTDLSPATAAWKIQATVINPPPVIVCNPRPASPFVTDSAKLSKKLRIAATVSHSDARPGQVVSVQLNANAKKKKALKKSLKSVVVSSGGTTVATLKGSKWNGSFTVADGQADDLSLKFVRKKGKAITKSASLDVLPACVS